MKERLKAWLGRLFNTQSPASDSEDEHPLEPLMLEVLKLEGNKHLDFEPAIRSTTTFESGYLNVADLLRDLHRLSLAITFRNDILPTLNRVQRREISLDDFYLDDSYHSLRFNKTTTYVISRAQGLIRSLRLVKGELPPAQYSYYERISNSALDEVKALCETIRDWAH